MIQLIGTSFLFVGIIAAAAVFVHYGLSSPWWESRIGWSYMLLTGSISAIGLSMVATLTTRMFPEQLSALVPVLPWLRVVCFALFAISMVALLVVYLVERRSAD